MSIQSEVPTKAGLKAAVYTAARSGREYYTSDVYALIIDGSKGNFHNIASAAIVKREDIGAARYGSPGYASLLEQAQKVCEGWAA